MIRLKALFTVGLKTGTAFAAWEMLEPDLSKEKTKHGPKFGYKRGTLIIN